MSLATTFRSSGQKDKINRIRFTSKMNVENKRPKIKLDKVGRQLLPFIVWFSLYFPFPEGKVVIERKVLYGGDLSVLFGVVSRRGVEK